MSDLFPKSTTRSRFLGPSLLTLAVLPFLVALSALLETADLFFPGVDLRADGGGDLDVLAQLSVDVGLLRVVILRVLVGVLRLGVFGEAVALDCPRPLLLAVAVAVAWAGAGAGGAGGGRSCG